MSGDKKRSYALHFAILIACVTAITLAVLTINVIVNPVVLSEDTRVSANTVLYYGPYINGIGLAGFLTSILLFLYHVKKDKGFLYLSIGFALSFLANYAGIYSSYTNLQSIAATSDITRNLQNAAVSASYISQSLFYILNPLTIWLELYGITSLVGYSRNLHKNSMYASIIILCSGLLPWFQIGNLLVSLSWTSPVVTIDPRALYSVRIETRVRLVYHLLMLSSILLLSASILRGKIMKLLIAAGGSCALFSCIFFLFSVFSDQELLLIGGPSIGPFICLIGIFGLLYVFLQKESQTLE